MKNRMSTYQLATCALFTALMCIFGPMSVPIGPVPVSLTNLVLYLAVFVIGTKATAISYVAYLLLGAFGLPVFSGYAGGLAKITGPTGGYLVLGLLSMAILCGIAVEKTKGNLVICIPAMVLATFVDYLFGTLWFVFMMQCEWGYALSVCVIPFIPFDIAKVVIACIIGKQIRKVLVRAGLVE